MEEVYHTAVTKATSLLDLPTGHVPIKVYGPEGLHRAGCISKGKTMGSFMIHQAVVTLSSVSATPIKGDKQRHRSRTHQLPWESKHSVPLYFSFALPALQFLMPAHQRHALLSAPIRCHQRRRAKAGMRGRRPPPRGPSSSRCIAAQVRCAVCCLLFYNSAVWNCLPRTGCVLCCGRTRAAFLKGAFFASPPTPLPSPPLPSPLVPALGDVWAGSHRPSTSLIPDRLDPSRIPCSSLWISLSSLRKSYR
jgi:hypothetical protein